jgi:hypothetical protein
MNIKLNVESFSEPCDRDCHRLHANKTIFVSSIKGSRASGGKIPSCQLQFSLFRDNFYWPIQVNFQHCFPCFSYLDFRSGKSCHSSNAFELICRRDIGVWPSMSLRQPGKAICVDRDKLTDENRTVKKYQIEFTGEQRHLIKSNWKNFWSELNSDVFS